MISEFSFRKELLTRLTEFTHYQNTQLRGMQLYSGDMKTQHIKIEILNERLNLFKNNLIQLNFVLNMLAIGRICNTNFHPFGDVIPVWMLVTDKVEISRIKSFGI